MEGYRGALGEFEAYKDKIEKEFDSKLLLRPIQRWDLNYITDIIFDNQEVFKKEEMIEHHYARLSNSHDIATKFIDRYESIATSGKVNNYKSNLADEMYELLKESEFKYGPFTIKKDKGN